MATRRTHLAAVGDGDKADAVPERREPTTLATLTSSGAVFVWAARVVWLVVAVLGGRAVGDALAGRSRAVQVTGTIAAWAGWGAAALTLAVTGVLALTALRSLVPGALVVTVATVVGGATASSVLALAAPAIVAVGLTCSAELGRVYVQASAYGDEQRFGLRPPLGYLAASVVSWLVMATATVVAPLALAGRGWWLGGAALLVAGAGAWLLPRRWHQLSRRWFVFVPAGAVVHDPVVLADTLMLARATVRSIGLDTDGSGRRRAADLSGPTPGVGLEVHLTTATTAVFAATPRQPTGRTIHLTALVVTPSRPGAALRAAGARGLPVAG